MIIYGLWWKKITGIRGGTGGYWITAAKIFTQRKADNSFLFYTKC